MTYLCDHQVVLEICPTSNLKTGSVARLEDHPVRLARELVRGPADFYRLRAEDLVALELAVEGLAVEAEHPGGEGLRESEAAPGETGGGTRIRTGE